jgi:hypothetical protein
VKAVSQPAPLPFTTALQTVIPAKAGTHNPEPAVATLASQQSKRDMGPRLREDDGFEGAGKPLSTQQFLAK